MNAYQEFKKDFKNKKILIMGLGLHGGGVGVAKFFSEIGCQVTVTDLKNKSQLHSSLKQIKNLKINLVLGEHREKDFRNHDIVIRNPSVPKTSKYLRIAKRHNVAIKMEAALFAKYTNTNIVGITGTRGKSTTAHLVSHVLKDSKTKSILAGNLPGKAALPYLSQVESDTQIVLELSSWQLQGFADEKISPHIAVITNIYPDHLNRYKSMGDYIEDKQVIFKFQTKHDYLVLNKNDAISKKFALLTKSKVVWFSSNHLSSKIKLQIPGEHNRENAAAALKIAKILKIDYQSAISSIQSFKGIPYRLETITSLNGIQVINDTTSTTATATIKALDSLEKPIILLLGGESKNLPLKKLANKINSHKPRVVLLSGSGTKELRPLLNANLIKAEFNDQKKAVRFAVKLAKSGDIVLFSPGFTSFGMFNNEFERGEAFNQTIKNLPA